MRKEHFGVQGWSQGETYPAVIGEYHRDGQFSDCSVTFAGHTERGYTRDDAHAVALAIGAGKITAAEWRGECQPEPGLTTFGADPYRSGMAPESAFLRLVS